MSGYEIAANAVFAAMATAYWLYSDHEWRSVEETTDPVVAAYRGWRAGFSQMASLGIFTHLTIGLLYLLLG